MGRRSHGCAARALLPKHTVQTTAPDRVLVGLSSPACRKQWHVDVYVLHVMQLITSVLWNTAGGSIENVIWHLYETDRFAAISARTVWFVFKQHFRIGFPDNLNVDGISK